MDTLREVQPLFQPGIIIVYVHAFLYVHCMSMGKHACVHRFFIVAL